MVQTERASERAFLLGVQIKGQWRHWTVEDSLEELAELARSVGAHVVGRRVQKLDRPTSLYAGKGKLEELRLLAQSERVDTLICDDELTPNQQRKLEDTLQPIKVLDRTALILDVFGRRAQTREGRLQVELAQHEYLLPRLAGQWSHLERLGGGIGTRGPGETQLETDRRLVHGRIQRLKSSVEDVRRRRGLYRSRRRSQGIPVASMVGYTNAGKSTLLNSLTGAAVVAEDRMFSTLDPVTRRVFLPSGRELLLTDTVGFIHKLPPLVVAAFRATLEEAHESTLVLHVVDMTHPNVAEQAQVVDDILRELGLHTKPRLTVLNKSDLIPPGAEASPNGLAREMPLDGRRVVTVSALRRLGLQAALAEIDDILSELELLTPVAASGPIAPGRLG